MVWGSGCQKADECAVRQGLRAEAAGDNAAARECYVQAMELHNPEGARRLAELTIKQHAGALNHLQTAQSFEAEWVAWAEKLVDDIAQLAETTQKLGGNADDLSAKLSVYRPALRKAKESVEQGAEASRREIDRAGETKTIVLPGGATMEMVRCPPGRFLMGSPEREMYVQFQHPVTIPKGFWIAKTEVTQKQWKSVMGTNPSKHRGDDLPVENVSWEECAEFCRKVGLQLPTEAEWEYACRAGSAGPYAGRLLPTTEEWMQSRLTGSNPYDGTGGLAEMGWYDENSGREPHPVGEKLPNAWGLHDMHGNVEEWCVDYVEHSPPEDHYALGGSYDSEGRSCRSFDRRWRAGGSESDNIGFRPVSRQD